MSSLNWKLMAGLLLLIGLSGCWNINQGRFAVIALDPIDQSSQYEMVAADAVGEDKTLYWALHVGKPRFDDAVRDVLVKYNGSYMTDATIREKMWFIPLIYGELRYEIRGKVWTMINTDKDESER